jgi:hypothetical protein
MSEDAGDQSLDSVHVDTLLKARQRCGEKPATTVRIFERNDFYYFFEKVRTRTCRSPKAQRISVGNPDDPEPCFGLPDPDPLVGGTDQAPDPSLFLC